MEAIRTEKAPAAIGPYSQGILAGGMIYVSGQLPLDPASGTLETGPAPAANRSLRNVEAILNAAGASLGDVVKVTIFLTNMADFAAVNEEYEKHFTVPYPARACVAVKELPKGAVLEIDAVAVSRG